MDRYRQEVGGVSGMSSDDMRGRQTPAPLALAPDSGALRAHLSEAEWQTVVASARSGGATVTLPPWAEPHLSGVGEPGATESTSANSEPTVPDRVDPALAEAVRMDGTAVEIDVASSSGEVGLIGVVRTDLTSGSAIVRRIKTAPGGGPQSSTLLEGAEVSGFTIDQLLDEVMRLIPPVEAVVTVEPAAIPMEVSAALGAAMRRGEREMVERVCAQLGLGEPPAILSSLVFGLTGSLSVSIRSAGVESISLGSWMLADCGWVEIRLDKDDIAHHEPRSRDDIRTRLLTDIATRIDQTLRASARAARSQS